MQDIVNRGARLLGGISPVNCRRLFVNDEQWLGAFGIKCISSDLVQGRSAPGGRPLVQY